MGVTNVIIDDRTVCPKCKFEMEGGICWDSKDIGDRMNAWRLGERINLKHGNLIFVANGDDVWKGLWYCYKCKTYFDSEIIIKDGVITEIKITKEGK